jgi:hypothetical protein
MEYCQGREASVVWHKLSSREQTAILTQLEGFLGQLRSLEPPSPEFVSSTLGGACCDHRFGINLVGPFDMHVEFHQLNDSWDVRVALTLSAVWFSFREMTRQIILELFGIQPDALECVHFANFHS